MTEHLRCDPRSVHRKIRKLHPGLHLVLEGGENRYTDPIVVSDLSGSQAHPIVITGDGAVIGDGTKFDDYRKRGNKVSKVQEAGGRNPGVYYIADNAALIIRNCQWLIIKDLRFDGCWPTAVYLENCQHITLRGLHIRGGTFAIGATGRDTRHLMIEDCDWIQDASCVDEKEVASTRAKADKLRKRDPSKLLLWKEIDWERIHGFRQDTERLVDVECDARAFDGDFFRAWTIAGYVIIRNNRVFDAFNGVHFFNQAPDDVRDAFSRNVLIENNWFVRIRDNAVEPENFAWNWTVRHNRFVDCYATYSIEMNRSGFFYIYGNLGWNFHRPGPPSDERKTGRIFKLPTKHEADGPHYIVHNSWLLRGPLFKKKRFANLKHFNNAIGYYEKGEEFSYEKAAPFGKGWTTSFYPSEPWDVIKAGEKDRFTKAWEGLEIDFDGDAIGHPLFPDSLRAAGYPIGASARRLDSKFVSNDIGHSAGLELIKPEPGIAFTVKLPDGQSEDCAGKHVGAWQGKDLFALKDPLFVEHWPYPNEKTGM